MKLSVVILNYNVRYFLELCLKSVTQAIKDLDAEIIVVDNNSSDDSCEMVTQLFPDVLLIENKENFGFSKGNNIGVAKTKGEYICILNPDTVVAEDTFKKVLEFAETKQDLGIVGCQLIDGTGKFLPESKRHVPTTMVSLQKMLNYTNNYYDNTLNSDAVGKTEILVGAFMLLKRNVYNEVNGFDEDYFMYGEDIDLSYRILKEGYANYYFGEAAIIHFKGESTLKDRVYAERFYGAMEIFYKKHFKRNVLFSGLVKLGVKLASKKGRKEELIKTEVSESVVLSDSIPEKLKINLKQPVTVTLSLEQIPSEAQVIFDANYFSFKTIIDVMKQNNARTDISYRILPKNSTFILGSDSSVSRGEVLHF